MMTHIGEIALLIDTVGSKLGWDQWIHIFKVLNINITTARDIGVTSETIEKWISQTKLPSSSDHRLKLAKYAERILGSYKLPFNFISRGRVHNILTSDYIQLKVIAYTHVSMSLLACRFFVKVVIIQWLV